jgi:hypothetical protein
MMGINVASPHAYDRWKEWWIETRKNFRKRELRVFHTFVILVSWRHWKQRNARAFTNPRAQFTEEGLMEQIYADWKQWSKAGLGGCNLFARVVH